MSEQSSEHSLDHQINAPSRNPDLKDAHADESTRKNFHNVVDPNDSNSKLRPSVPELKSKIQFGKNILIETIAPALKNLPGAYTSWFSSLASQYNTSDSDTSESLESKLAGLNYVMSHADAYISTFHAIESARSQVPNSRDRMAFENQLSNLQSSPFVSVAGYAGLLHEMQEARNKPIREKQENEEREAREAEKQKLEAEQKQKREQEIEKREAEQNEIEKRSREKEEAKRKSEERQKEELDRKKQEELLKKTQESRDESQNETKNEVEKKLKDDKEKLQTEERGREKSQEEVLRENKKEVEESATGQSIKDLETLVQETIKIDETNKVREEGDLANQKSDELKQAEQAKNDTELAEEDKVQKEENEIVLKKEELIPEPLPIDATQRVDLSEDKDLLEIKKNKEELLEDEGKEVFPVIEEKKVLDEPEFQDESVDSHPDLPKLESHKKFILNELLELNKSLLSEDQKRFQFQMKKFEESFSDNIQPEEAQMVLKKLEKLKFEMTELSDGLRTTALVEKVPTEDEINEKEAEIITIETPEPPPIVLAEEVTESRPEPETDDIKPEVIEELEEDIEANKEELVPIVVEPLVLESEEGEESIEKEIADSSEDILNKEADELKVRQDLDQKKEVEKKLEEEAVIENLKITESALLEAETLKNEKMEEEKREVLKKEEELKALQNLDQKEKFEEEKLQEKDIENQDSFGGLEDEIDVESLKDLEPDTLVEVVEEIKEEGEKPEDKIEEKDKELEELQKALFIPLPIFEKSTEESKEIEDDQKEIIKVLDEYRSELEMLEGVSEKHLEDLALKIQYILENAEPSELISQLQDLLAGIPPESINEALSKILSTHFGNELVASYIMEFTKNTKNSISVQELASLIKSLAKNSAVEITIQPYSSYQTLELKLNNSVFMAVTEIFVHAKAKRCEVAFSRRGSEFVCSFSFGGSIQKIETISFTVMESFVS